MVYAMLKVVYDHNDDDEDVDDDDADNDSSACARALARGESCTKYRRKKCIYTLCMASRQVPSPMFQYQSILKSPYVNGVLRVHVCRFCYAVIAACGLCTCRGVHAPNRLGRVSIPLPRENLDVYSIAHSMNKLPEQIRLVRQ